MALLQLGGALDTVNAQVPQPRGGSCERAYCSGAYGSEVTFRDALFSPPTGTD